MAQLEVCHVQRSQNPISSRRWSQNGPESSEACPAELESKNKAKCVQWKWKWKWKCVQPEKFVSSSAEMPSNWARIRYRAAAAETPNRQYYPNLSQLMPTYANSMSLKDKTSQQWQHNLSLSYVKTFALWREMFFILFSSFVFCVLVQRKYWQLFSNWLLLNGWLRSLFSALQGLTVKPGAATTKKSV